MAIKLERVYLNNWISAGKHVYREVGDFWQVTGLYPTLDRQGLRRAPAFSAHLTHSGLSGVAGMFYDGANSRYVLIGQDGSSQLACSYFSSAWAHVGATYVLDTAVSAMDGLSMLNYIYAHGYLWVLAHGDTQRTDNYVTTALSNWNTVEGIIITYVGGRIYVVRDDMRIYQMISDGSALENHYNPADDLAAIYATGLKDDLLIVAAMLNGELRVYRTSAYAKTAIRKLEDMAVLPGDTGEYPSAGCPFCVHDNDLYLLSGSMSNPDGTETRDLLAYTGYRVERIARLDGVDAAALSLGLFSWRGELIYYEITTSAAKFRMLIGNALVDLAEVSSYSGSGMAPIAGNLGGEMVVTGKSGGNEGVYHAGGSALGDGNVETAWLDGGRPGVKKRLVNLSMHVKGPSSNTVKTLSYRVDDETSYTQAATATSAAEMLEAASLGVVFYRLRIKAAVGDSSSTQDVRLVGVSYSYAVGDE